MPDFTVDPADMRNHAQFLGNNIAPTYAKSSQSVRTGSEIDAPGFGIALSFLEAAYLQKVDFLAKDLQGAHDLCWTISARLMETAANFERAENLNISGFGGTPVHQESYGTAYGDTGAAN